VPYNVQVAPGTCRKAIILRGTKKILSPRGIFLLGSHGGGDHTHASSPGSTHCWQWQEVASNHAPGDDCVCCLHNSKVKHYVWQCAIGMSAIWQFILTYDSHPRVERNACNTIAGLLSWREFLLIAELALRHRCY